MIRPMSLVQVTQKGYFPYLVFHCYDNKVGIGYQGIKPSPFHLYHITWKWYSVYMKVVRLFAENFPWK